jgi:hypothetical protein
MLRAVLVQAAWAVLRNPRPDPLKEWGLGIIARRGKAIGAVAVARRLLGIGWAMWRDGTAYDPELLGRESATGVNRQAQRANLKAEAIPARRSQGGDPPTLD